MFTAKNSVFFLAALNVIICSSYGKFLEIVNDKPQLRERRMYFIIGLINILIIFLAFLPQLKVSFVLSKHKYHWIDVREKFTFCYWLFAAWSVYVFLLFVMISIVKLIWTTRKVVDLDSVSIVFFSFFICLRLLFDPSLKKFQKLSIDGIMQFTNSKTCSKNCKLRHRKS